MKNHEKALVVLLMGSLWGAVELFGADLLRAWHVSNKSASLFGLAVIVMYSSKKITHFPGSVILMALVAGLFKTASSSFHACQAAAVIIIGGVFDGTYSLSKSYLDSNPVYRSLGAPVIAYASYVLFAFAATYIIREPNWVAAGLPGIGDYLASSALGAAALGIIGINAGYYLGMSARHYLESMRMRAASIYLRLGSLAAVVLIWLAGQMY